MRIHREFAPGVSLTSRWEPSVNEFQSSFCRYPSHYGLSCTFLDHVVRYLKSNCKPLVVIRTGRYILTREDNSIWHRSKWMKLVSAKARQPGGNVLASAEISFDSSYIPMIFTLPPQRSNHKRLTQLILLTPSFA